MNDKNLCGANHERNVRDGQIQVPPRPRADRRGRGSRHGTRQRLHPTGPSDLGRDQLPACRAVAVLEHQEREHSKARDAGNRVRDPAAAVVPDAAGQWARRLHRPQADRGGPDGNGRIRPRTAGAGRVVPLSVRLEILHGAAPRDARGEGRLRPRRDRLERGDARPPARQADRGHQESPIPGAVEASDGGSECPAVRAGPRHRGPRVVQEDRGADDRGVPEPPGPERHHHRRSGVLEGGVRDRRISPSRAQEKGPAHVPRHRLHGRVRFAGARREVAGDPKRPGPHAREIARPAAYGRDPQGGRRLGGVRGGPGATRAPAGRRRNAPRLRGSPEVAAPAPLRERRLGRREDGRRGRGVADLSEGWGHARRRREPRPHRGSDLDRRGHGDDGRAHLEGLRGRPAPPPGVRRDRGDLAVPGDVMGHDPGSELRDRAERVRRSIESELRVTTPGILQEAPADRGLFALAAHAWAKELKESPASIATRASRVKPVTPFAPLRHEGPYVNFTVDPSPFAELVLTAVRADGETYGASPARKERVLLEHTSANPTGPLHVGRARDPFLGDALVRLLRAAGYPVTSEYLVNDIGRQMVLLYWASDAILDGSVQRIVERLIPLSKEEGGAHYLDLSAFGLEGDAAKYVFVRRDGTSLYTTRDIAYHLNKMGRCDVAIDIVGEDHKLSFQRLKAAFQLMGIDWAPETIFYAFVNLPEGRMSTRKGRVVYLDDLIDEAVDRAYAEVTKRREDLPEAKKREIAETIGVQAVAAYAADFTSQFNQFYRDCPVLSAEPAGLRGARIDLVDASRIVLRNALDGLGLRAPAEM